MESANIDGPDETATHHIVASTSAKASEGRAHLSSLGMDINDASNGVFLPSGSKSVNPNGASVHSRIHTDKYYKYVNSMIGGARTIGEARDVLGYIFRQLLDGRWP